MAKVDELLRRMPDNNASDLHLVAGQRPKFALHGEVVDIEDWDELDNDFLRDLLLEVIDEEQTKHYLSHWDLDHAYAIEGVARFRCNFYMQRTGFGGVFRIMPRR